MIVKIHTPSSTPKGNNKGSSTTLFNYLSKEDEKKEHFDKTYFFSHDSDTVSKEESINTIDSNKGKLGKDEYKFYMLTINPSDREQSHLLPAGFQTVDELNKEQLREYEHKLMDYTRDVMDNYADSFHRDVQGKDLVYFAKIEHERTYKNTDTEVQNNSVNQRQKKEGRQSHIHVVVSRYNKEKTKKLSPLSKNRAKKNNTVITNGKNKNLVQQGFNHAEFRQENEQSFDSRFEYKRAENETFKHNMEQKEQNLTGKSQLQNVANTAMYSELSPVTPIAQKMREQDIQHIFSNELKQMNPIATFLKEEKKQIVKGISYAAN